MRYLSVLLSLTVLLAAIGLSIASPAPLQRLQAQGFDTLQQLHPRPYTDQPVRIIDIDDESLSRLGQWPWPRTLVASLIHRLQEAGASAIALDIVFAEPDRTSPSQILPLWPSLTAAAANAITELPDHDQLLAQTFSQGGVITGFVLTNQGQTTPPRLAASFAHAGSDPRSALPAFPSSVNTLAALEAEAAGNGALNSTPDSDGILRYVPLLFRLNDQLYPSLATESLRVAQGASTLLIKSVGASGEQGEGDGITSIKNGAFEIPTDAEGRFWVYYTQHVPERYIPAWKILEPDFDATTIEGQILFIGTSAAGLKDIRSTPLNPATSGVEIHAQAIEQILSGTYLTRPDWTKGAELLAMAISGLLIVILLHRTGAIIGALATLTALAGAATTSWYAFTQHGLLLDGLYPSLAIFLVYLSASFTRYLATEREKKQVRNAFSHYMSPALVDELAKNPDQLKLGGETREMTLLFCDIRGFTTLSELFDAEGLTRFINRFLTPMTDVILSHRGTIDKYMGDAIMAFWNAPLLDEAHASHACDAALAMIESLQQLNATRKAECEKDGSRFLPINIGIGLNSGPCCVGNMGSDQRFDYSVLGDDVNLASRLEGQSKPYGVSIVIGENTQKLVPDYASIELDLIQVKGKTKPVRIHTLLGAPALTTDPTFQTLQKGWATMLEQYRSQQFKAAQKTLKSLNPGPFPIAGLFELYEERLTHFLKHPPAKDWDGVYIATSK